MFACFSGFSQDRDFYYLEVKEGHELGEVQTTTETDQTLNFSLTNSDFASFLNNKSLYLFDKAFPSGQSARLQRVYLISLDSNTSINDFYNRVEIEKFLVVDDEILINENALHNNIAFDIYIEQPIPDDYEDLLTGGRNTSLDIIKAPLAWTIAVGNPNILIGVSDAESSLDHEDLEGQIIETIFLGNYSGNHGATVVGQINAITNNNKGIASIAHNSKVVFASTSGGVMGSTGLINGLAKLSENPEIRIINCSWSICYTSSSSIEYLDEVMYGENGIIEKDILVVASAGNGTGSSYCDSDYYGYRYPASYDEVLSVTSVGHRFPIGFHHNLTPPGSQYPFSVRSWKDVHLPKPHTTDTSSTTHNDKVDICAPGQLLTLITTNYEDYPEGYVINYDHVSPAAPIVTGVAALVLDANPNLTAAEVKDIIKTTADDIYYIPYNQPYFGQLGTGRINAYRAVLKAQCMLNPTTAIDLAMQNSMLDSFDEPDIETEHPWRSEDIWVRNQNDGILIKEHQNPEYDPNNPNYVYVRVTNNSCETTSGNDALQLSWAKANTALSWPNHWDGTLFINDPDTGEDILMGDEIATISIPPLEVGQEAIIEFEWNIPNPEDFENINDNPWHFCLLARIKSIDDPMSFPEGEAITQNVLNNNNIAWKNTTVVDIIPDDTPIPIGGVVAVGNYFSQQKAFSLEFIKEINELGKPIYEEAEVTIEMDDVLYNAWAEGGYVGQNTDSTKVASKRIITGNNAILDNIILDPNEIGTLYVTFNFLTKELTNKTEFIYHIIQRDAVTNEIIGGETFEIRKKPRESFLADAGNDEEIDKNETITINAGQINEDAIYNWYDPEGNLIYTGTDLTVSPEVTKSYKLEIISSIDGFKDYDEVEITVNPYKLESLIPNPASQSFTVNYIAEGASSAYVMIVNMNTGSSDNYILDVQQNSTSIDVSTYTAGLYNIILVCDGEVQNSKTLLKQ